MAAIVPRLHVMRWAISGTVISLFARSHTIRFTSCSLRGQPCLAISTKPLPLFQRNTERLEATNFNVVFNSLKVYETNRMILCSGVGSKKSPHMRIGFYHSEAACCRHLSKIRHSVLGTTLLSSQV